MSAPEGSPRPADGNDPQDPLRPEIEEENEGTPPAADPSLDVEATEDQQDATENPLDNLPDDDDSELSDVDEAAFDDFDEKALEIEERPKEIDETNIGLIGSHKRKRAAGEEGPEKRKKKKGKRSKRHFDDEVDGSARGANGRRERKSKGAGSGGARSRPRAQSPEDLSHMTEAQRARHELEKKMNEALRNPMAGRRKVTGIDLEAANDELLDQMAQNMTNAAEKDANEHKANRPAFEKLAMLPKVMELLNRDSLQHTITEPDSRILEACRFFLEPLEPDGALPAYDVQRQIIGALSRMPLEKDALSSSGIGRVMLFYTKSKRPEVLIKRAAERLIGEWTRPILKRGGDSKKSAMARARIEASQATKKLTPAQLQAKLARDRILAKPVHSSRALVDRQLPSYTIAPQSNVVARETGRSGMDTFAKIKARQSKPRGV